MKRNWLVFACCIPMVSAGACAPSTVEKRADPTPAALSLAQSCSGCHTPRGGDGIPGIGAMDSETLSASLMYYKSDSAGTTVMHRLTRGYTDEEISAIAAWLGNKAVE